MIFLKTETEAKNTASGSVFLFAFVYREILSGTSVPNIDCNIDFNGNSAEETETLKKEK